MPLALLVGGAWLWQEAAPAPGMPTVIPGLGLSAIAVDGVGALYVADGVERGLTSTAGMGNHCVWRISRWGSPRRVAGTGTPGYSGDGGPAADARLFFPTDLALDPQGRLYIADAGEHRVRRVERNGTISTVAGCGRPASDGNGGLATGAGLRSPGTIAVDARGHLFIAESDVSHVRVVDAAGVITGLPVPCQPWGMAIEQGGGLVVADFRGHRILRVGGTGAVALVAGSGRKGCRGDGGPAARARLARPADVAVDAAGNLFIADMANYRVREVDRRGRITTVAGCGRSGYTGDGRPAAETGLDLPHSLAAGADGTLYIADCSSVRKVGRGGIITTVVTDQTRFGQ